MTTNLIFSIVVAAHNVSSYIEEAIESIINQDYDFKKVEIILVNDGSTDSTGSMCDKYAAKYDNIKVIHQENRGVSNARNNGLKLASGRYINFLDGDDKLSPNTLNAVSSFYEKYKDKTDVVSIPLRFFGERDGDHILNDKFQNGTRLIDLNIEPDTKQLSIASCFIQKQALTNRMFDERLEYAEDAKLLQEIFLDSPRLGVVAESCYEYRKHSDSDSAIGNAFVNPAWYITSLQYFSRDLIRICLKKYKKIPRFLQHVLAYDLQFKIMQASIPMSVMSEVDKKRYKKLLWKVYDYIDDDIIFEQWRTSFEAKFMIVSKKRNKLPQQERYDDGRVIYSFGDVGAFDISYAPVTVEFIKLSKESIEIEGWLPRYKYMDDKTVPLFVEADGIKYEAILFNRNSDRRCVYACEEKLFDVIGFRLNIPIDHEIKIRFFRETKFGPRIVKALEFSLFAPLTRSLDNMYFQNNGWILRREDVSLVIRKEDGDSKAYEKPLLRELYEKGERRAVISRILVNFLRRHILKRPIWLISDRLDKADDNGEAFFEFLQKNHKKDVNSYFILDKKNVDYKRLRRIGPIIQPQSFKHLILHLLCEYNISAFAPVATVNPFLEKHYCFCDLLQNVKFIFLQHGIIREDISGWLNRFNQNATGFIVSSQKEFDLVYKNPECFFEKSQIWLTGLARFDRLIDAREKIITIAPTWRDWLFSEHDMTTNSRILSNDFKKSDYYIFYNNLINHPRLLSAAKKMGYQLWFVPHPILQPYLNLFDNNNEKIIRFCDEELRYRDIFRRSSLMLTDYSSVIYDFIYMKKPVVYCQFDYDLYKEKGKSAYTPGDYDYERQGFGEVQKDLEGTVDRLIEYMQNECKMKSLYRNRADSFFAFHDKNNCERIYKKILEDKKSNS